jgi:N-acyl-D-aspartate/D-glutamate deacylase
LLDIVIEGGRVIDPESGRDEVANVGITADRIQEVGSRPLDALRVIDARGQVVAPGFIDLHSHAQDLNGARLQALDGVTTALELEAGATPVELAYGHSARQGRPINYGFSAGWALARLEVVAGTSWTKPEVDTSLEFFEHHQTEPRWNTPATPRELDAILARLADQLDVGALGIGVLLGYAPDTDPTEFAAIAELAANRDVPVFVHSRRMSIADPNSSLEGVREILDVAGRSGAHLHVCHVNSTSLRLIREVAAELREARARGARVTTEAYPYGAGSTGIGSEFFAPERLERMGLHPTDLRYLRTGERIATLKRLAEVRAQDPGGLCVFDFLDLEDEGDRELMLTSLLLPGAAIASDAMPITYPEGERDRERWPISAGARVHPRSAGCFSRVLQRLVRESGVLTLSEAIERMSLTPARILERSVPSMKRKGRLRVGSDADIVVFDPAEISDRGTFDRLEPSQGVRHLLVNGRLVVSGGLLDLSAAPGRPIQRASRPQVGIP